MKSLLILQAFFETKLLTSLILQRYLIRVKKGTVALPAESLTMPIQGGLPVYAHKRTEFFILPKAAAGPSSDAAVPEVAHSKL